MKICRMIIFVRIQHHDLLHRGSKSTDEYLETVLKSQSTHRDYEIFQYFRHSAIGWGTAEFNGDDSSGNKQKIMVDLFEYYHKMGYIIPGMEEYLEVIHADWDRKNRSNIYISSNGIKLWNIHFI